MSLNGKVHCVFYVPVRSHNKIHKAPRNTKYERRDYERVVAESIEWFMEDQAFLPTLFSLSRQEVVSLSQSSSVSPVELTDRRREEGVGEELN